MYYLLAPLKLLFLSRCFHISLSWKITNSQGASFTIKVRVCSTGRSPITFTLTWPYYPPDAKVVIDDFSSIAVASFLSLASENTFCIKS